MKFLITGAIFVCWLGLSGTLCNARPAQQDENVQPRADPTLVSGGTPLSSSAPLLNLDSLVGPSSGTFSDDGNEVPSLDVPSNSSNLNFTNPPMPARFEGRYYVQSFQDYGVPTAHKQAVRNFIRDLKSRLASEFHHHPFTPHNGWEYSQSSDPPMRFVIRSVSVWGVNLDSIQASVDLFTTWSEEWTVTVFSCNIDLYAKGGGPYYPDPVLLGRGTFAIGPRGGGSA